MIVFLPLQSFAKAVVFYRKPEVGMNEPLVRPMLLVQHFSILFFQLSDWFMHVNLPVYDQGFLISSSFFLCTVKDVFFSI